MRCVHILNPPAHAVHGQPSDGVLSVLELVHQKAHTVSKQLMLSSILHDALWKTLTSMSDGAAAWAYV
jgi:hypothetical protein